MRPIPKPDFTWEEIDQLREKVKLETREGGITAAEYAEKYGISIQAATRQLISFAEKGKMTRSKCLVPTTAGPRIANLFRMVR